MSRLSNVNPLTYIEILVAITGVTAATVVATGQPQPYFGMAFWLYTVSAAMGIYMTYKRKMYFLMLLFCFYLGIDSYGVYNWWPF